MLICSSNTHTFFFEQNNHIFLISASVAFELKFMFSIFISSTLIVYFFVALMCAAHLLYTLHTTYMCIQTYFYSMNQWKIFSKKMVFGQIWWNLMISEKEQKKNLQPHTLPFLCFMLLFLNKQFHITIQQKFSKKIKMDLHQFTNQKNVIYRTFLMFSQSFECDLNCYQRYLTK